ncbi:MAG: hypothetical protein LBC86_07005 [Oscillospiraceae bacterium]|jgi:hypothetical protein|nr:hypothetical protein [Oscillospiraceae bacterium]
MKNLFESTCSSWVKYSEYEYRRGEDGVLYITPTAKATPKIYNPFDNMEEMIIEALNVNRIGSKKTEDELKQSILEFINKYGLLGFMTGLPTTPDFMDYDAVYFPKNEFIDKETMTTRDFTDIFFPFKKPNYIKDKNTAAWFPESDVHMSALALTMGKRPMALNIMFARDYAERYEWLKMQFKSWAFTCMTAIMYYHDRDVHKADEAVLYTYRQAMSAFKGIAPTYHVALFDEKPTITWEFNSLLLGIQMMFSFMLTDGTKPLRMCKHCKNTFAATHHNAVFCSGKCKNQYNVYKSRGRQGE